MYLRVRLHVSVRAWVCGDACARVRWRVCTTARAHVCVCVCVSVYVRAMCISVCASVSVCARAHVRCGACMRVHVQERQRHKTGGREEALAALRRAHLLSCCTSCCNAVQCNTASRPRPQAGR